MRLNLVLVLGLSAQAMPATAQPPETSRPSIADARSARAERALTLGERYLAAGDPGTAAGYFRDAVQVDPRCIEAYVQLGGALAGLDRHRDSIEAFTIGLGFAPTEHPARPQLWMGLAGAHEALAEFEDAARALRSLCRDAPEFVAGWEARANLAVRHSGWSEGLNAFRRVAELSAGNPGRRARSLQVIAALRILAPLDPLGTSCTEGSGLTRRLRGCEAATVD